ncbi:hypothetical protein FIU94_15960 [Sulfitobacter sp. THAF37]|uniref:REP-associated tyrosine transposase n=1 Tax=Sulfitobacter sp. THAF37 TaxID=2587855 RepID=UPI001267CE30|nr:transposase [Sulfitobacter sp. THAF37]QFT60324.1 hypothetical protein FIU94_15960 [Sulfitobacter sp. THAF37]
MSWHIGNRAGGTYFFTVRLADAESDALVRCIADLRRAMRHTLNHHPLRIDAIAVLPAVIHTIWTLPADRAGYSNRIGMLKAKFSRSMPMPGHRTPAQIARGEKGIWQRRFWEHRICDQADFDRHRDLVHLSPVHAGLVQKPQDWPHSSVHRDLRRGVQPPDFDPAAFPPRPATRRDLPRDVILQSSRHGQRPGSDSFQRR